MDQNDDRTCQTAPPLVGVVVLTWENYEETADCLDSLQSVSYPNYRVFVVDNGSRDGSIDRLEREYEWCKFVRNDKNLGVTRGNNAGIDRALAAGVDYVCLLNDDTVVSKSFLTSLVTTAEQQPDAAVVGGVNYFASTDEIHNAGASFSVLLGGQTFLYSEIKDDEPYPVEYAPTCLALIDADFLADQGGLCEEYFLGMEDVDLAWQARAAGHEVLVDPGAAIDHRLGETSSRSPFTVYHRIHNRLQFAARNLSPGLRVVFLLALFLRTLIVGGWWLVIDESDKARAALMGTRDYATGAEFRSHEEFT